LQAGDELSVSITDLLGEGSGEAVKTCKISPSGEIRLPFISPMAAAGMTQEELEKEIARQYAHTLQLNSAKITVELIERYTSVRVTVGKDGQIAVDGAPGNWDTLRDRLAKLSPEKRAKIFIALVADTGDVPVSVFFQQETAAQKLVDDLKLAYVSVAGINHATTHPAATRPDGLIYIGGNISRPGVYALSDHWITIKQFLTEAGGVQDEQTAMLTLTRRSNGVETFPLRDVPLRSLMNGDQADLYMEPDDVLQITTATPVQNTSVRVTVSKDGQIVIDGAAGTWDALRDRLAKLSPEERAHTNILLLLDTSDVPYSVLSQQLLAAKKLKDDFKLAYFAVAGTNHAESRPTSTRPD
jgi:protein involved in polysaccharide export with SLBB domain